MRKAIIAIALTTLAGCTVAPTRTEPSAFKLIAQGRINPADGLAFTDCLVDGFDRAHIMLTNTTVRQRRRPGEYRVESMVHSAALVSADIRDDGTVALFEARAAVLVATSDEAVAFKTCLDKFQAGLR